MIPTRRPSSIVVTLAILASLPLLGVACGTAEPLDGSAADDGPRVADPRFDGDWVIVDVDLEGRRPSLTQRPGLVIDARFGALTVQPGCNTYFGSFTLDDDGTASFTVTGGSDLACDALTSQEDAVLAALDGVSTWEVSDDGFRFTGPSASLEISRSNR